MRQQGARATPACIWPACMPGVAFPSQSGVAVGATSVIQVRQRPPIPALHAECGLLNCVESLRQQAGMKPDGPLDRVVLSGSATG
jgi:hypothetical protein